MEPSGTAVAAMGIGVLLVILLFLVIGVVLSALVLKFAAGIAGIEKRGLGICIAVLIIDYILGAIINGTIPILGFIIGFLVLVILIKAMMSASWGQAFVASILVYIFVVVFVFIMIAILAALGIGAAMLTGA